MMMIWKFKMGRGLCIYNFWMREMLGIAGKIQWPNIASKSQVLLMVEYVNNEIDY